MTFYTIILLALCSVAASEILLRLPLARQAQSVISFARRAAAILRSTRISDHWKERILPAYSVRMAGRSILLFLLLCIIVLPVGIAGLIAPGGLSRWLNLLMQPVPILILCACSILYIVARLRFSGG